MQTIGTHPWLTWAEKMNLMEGYKFATELIRKVETARKISRNQRGRRQRTQPGLSRRPFCLGRHSVAFHSEFLCECALTVPAPCRSDSSSSLTLSRNIRSDFSY